MRNILLIILLFSTFLMSTTMEPDQSEFYSNCECEGNMIVTETWGTVTSINPDDVPTYAMDCSISSEWLFHHLGAYNVSYYIGHNLIGSCEETCPEGLEYNQETFSCEEPPPVECPEHYSEDENGTCVPDDPEDIDGDGIPNSEDPDIDGDGIPNSEDPDIDGDGIPNSEDQTPSGQPGTGNNGDEVECAKGYIDINGYCFPDRDGNGVADYLEKDLDDPNACYRNGELIIIHCSESDQHPEKCTCVCNDKDKWIGLNGTCEAKPTDQVDCGSHGVWNDSTKECDCDEPYFYLPGQGCAFILDLDDINSTILLDTDNDDLSDDQVDSDTNETITPDILANEILRSIFARQKEQIIAINENTRDGDLKISQVLEQIKINDEKYQLDDISQLGDIEDKIFSGDIELKGALEKVGKEIVDAVNGDGNTTGTGSSEIEFVFDEGEVDTELSAYEDEIKGKFQEFMDGIVGDATILFDVSVPVVASCGCVDPVIDYKGFNKTVEICSPLDTLFGIMRPIMWFGLVISILFGFFRGGIN